MALTVAVTESQLPAFDGYQGRDVLHETKLDSGRAHRNPYRAFQQTGAGAKRLLGLIAEKATETMRREPGDFVASGVKNDGAPYLGPVASDARGLIQWVKVDKLLSASVRDTLFKQIAEETV